MKLIFLIRRNRYGRYYFNTKNQAPNMYVDWTDGGSYDFVIVDWYCETVANNTTGLFITGPEAMQVFSILEVNIKYCCLYGMMAVCFRKSNILSADSDRIILISAARRRKTHFYQLYLDSRKMVYNVHRNQNYKWKNLLCAMGS